MKLDWDKIVSNAVTVLVATVFVGAAMKLWNGVEAIDSRIDANLVDIKATQSVLAPKVDAIEESLANILKRLEDVDDIDFEVPDKGALELIDEEFNNRQMMEQQQQREGARP